MADINDILQIKTNNLKPSKGKILISEPFLIDYYFKRSVVLLAEHNEEGTFGLILNKPVEMLITDVIQDFPEFNAQVFLGGPVKTDNLYFIHTKGDIIEESLEIIPGVYWGGEIEHVKELITIGKIKPHDIKFFVGYSGWVSRQLENELEKNSWLVSNIQAKDIMAIDTTDLWNSAVGSMGEKYAYWNNFPADPVLN
jgi:putative transcriptional regulator